MKQYLKDYTKQIDNLIKNKKITNQDIENHLVKINFFQNERLIHLLFTLAYGIFLFLSIIISLNNYIFTLITIIIAIFLIFYVRHYFFLENHVQYLYKQYDEMKKIK